MAYLKLMLDEREIAHLSEDGQYLCANEGVLTVRPALEPLYRQQPQSPTGRCGRLGKEAHLSPESDGLQGDSGDDGPA